MLSDMTPVTQETMHDHEGRSDCNTITCRDCEGRV
jgi:hypothetical protein